MITANLANFKGLDGLWNLRQGRAMVTPDEIAGEFGITGKRFRDFLRETRSPTEHGQRYEFTRTEAIKPKSAYRARYPRSS
jgi:hypothetical protein